MAGGEGRRLGKSEDGRYGMAQGEEFKLYPHYYCLKAPSGKVPSLLLSNINHVMQSLHFLGP